MPQDTHPSEKEEKTTHHVIDLNKTHYKHLKEDDENSDSSAPSTPEISKKKPMQARNTPVRSPASFRVPLGENRETSSREEWAKFVREHQRRRKKEKQEFQNNLPKATLRFLKKQVRTLEMFVSVIFLLFFVSTFIASSFKKVRLADSELYHWSIFGCTIIWGFFIIKFFTKRVIKLSKRFQFFETYVYYFIHSSYRSISILILASIIFPFWQYFVPNIIDKEVIKYINLTFVVIIVLCATNLIRAIGTKLLTGMANKTHFHEQIVNALFNERMLANLLMPKKRTNLPKKKKLFSMKDLFGDVELRKFHSMSRLVQRRSFIALGEELSSWDEITSTERAQELAGKVFQNIDRKNKGYITKQDITNFVKPKYINKVFSVFDVDQDGKVVREEVEELVIRIYRERNALSNGLKDRENMGLVLTRIVKLVFWVVMFFVSLQIYGFPIMNWITPLAAFFVGFGFIFGESFKEIFSSIILIFAIHPYDVGDRVTINKGQIFIVESIYLLTTQFFTLEGKLVIMKNSTMAANQIENHKRSIIATHHMDLQIEFGTPMDKIVALRNVISHFLAARPKLWKPEFYFWISDLANSNRINILFWCTTRYIWQEGPTNWQLKTELFLHVKSKMTELGITYYSPPQNLFIRTSPEEREFISQLLI